MIIDNFADLKAALERNVQRDEARANSCTYCHGKGQVQPLKHDPTIVPCPKCNGIPQP